MQIDRHDTDILILGSGGAGLFAALHAQQTAPDAKVTIAVKGLLGKCGCTRMVQGGYNVAIGQGDSVERHFMDTIRGGKWLPDQDMAWKLCELAVERIRELENEVGCFFDRNPDGSLHQKAFAGQTYDRTVHKGDLTGIEIINRLMEQVLARPVERLNEHRAVGLIPAKDGAIAGVLFIDMRTGGFRFVRAKAVLMATGGGPTMYRYHTPSGDKTMDGLAMALRAGLPLRDMEMVQFHPTGLLAGEGTRMTGTVLEEGLRGAGGHLLNGDGERFMFAYDEKGERATRDVVSRGIYAEMQKNPTPNGGVYISMSHLGPENGGAEVQGHGETLRRLRLRSRGRASVEVVPTAHYFMGGVVVDPDTRTAMPGLYVAGRRRGRRAWLEPARRQRRGEFHGLWRRRGRGDGPRGDRRPARSRRDGAGGGNRTRPPPLLPQTRPGPRTAQGATWMRCGRMSASCAPRPTGMGRGLARVREIGTELMEGWRRRHHPRLQPHLARLAQLAQPLRRLRSHCRSRARPRKLPRRALPGRFSGGRRPRQLVLNRGTANR